MRLIASSTALARRARKRTNTGGEDVALVLQAPAPQRMSMATTMIKPVETSRLTSMEHANLSHHIPDGSLRRGALRLEDQCQPKCNRTRRLHRRRDAVRADHHEPRGESAIRAALCRNEDGRTRLRSAAVAGAKVTMGMPSATEIVFSPPL